MKSFHVAIVAAGAALALQGCNKAEEAADSNAAVEATANDMAAPAETEMAANDASANEAMDANTTEQGSTDHGSTDHGSTDH